MSLYEPEGFSLDIFKQRYAIHENETFQEASRRVSSYIAMAEKGLKRQEWEERFFQELSSNRFMPAGRIWYSAGRKTANMLNCFVVEASDSREGWGQLLYDTIVISGMGGGVGINFSDVRPRGSEIKGTGGHSTGSVSLMQLVNNCGEVIKDGGGRRTALMLSLGWEHPDCIEFLSKKLEMGQLTNANVSVLIEDYEQFINDVKNNREISLKWKDEINKKVNASEVFDKMVSNALKSGEPGILNRGLANEMNTLGYHHPMSTTNPCGEIWLPPGGCCDLGSVVLSRFVKDGELDLSLLANTVYVGVRLLDNVLDVNHYPLTKIKEVSSMERRIGLGITGLHDAMILCGIEYGSKKGNEWLDDVLCFIKEKAYESSCSLSVEKSPFPLYNDEFLESGFIKELNPRIIDKIKSGGIRNCALLTLPPCGTISIVCGCSSGIEPIYAPAYDRMVKGVGQNDETTFTTVIHPLYEKMYRSGKNLSHFKSANDISPKKHLEVQAICQSHIDNSVSKTINIDVDLMPFVKEYYKGRSETGNVELIKKTIELEGFSSIDNDLWEFIMKKTNLKENMKNLILDYLPRIKGVTFYLNGSRGSSPLTPIDPKSDKVISMLENNKEMNDCSGDIENGGSCPTCEI